MKKTLLAFLLTSIIVAQPQRRDFIPRTEQFFTSEIIVLPIDEKDFSVNYIYKVPYSILVFEKEGNEYNSNFRVLVEITDSASNQTEREFKDSDVSAGDFELTSDKEFFLQDYVSFELPAGIYEIRATLRDMNSQDEIKLEPISIDLYRQEDKSVFKPIVISSFVSRCDDEKPLVFANSDGSIPFSENDYHLAIPVTDTTLSKLSIEVKSNDTILYSETSGEFYFISAGIRKCENEIVLITEDDNTLTKIFVFRNINKNLEEGKIDLIVRDRDESLEDSAEFGSETNQNLAEFHLDIVWFNRPFSLQDPEKAIEYLEYIEQDSVIQRMLDEKESEYPKILNDYWSGYDPEPGTTFNPLMAEYYKRIDYAFREFRGIGKENGAATDRGMIYIRFGKPEKVERASNLQGQVTEAWFYTNPERKFIFVDKKGTGNFTLVNG